MNKHTFQTQNILDKLTAATDLLPCSEREKVDFLKRMLNLLLADAVNELSTVAKDGAWAFSTNMADFNDKLGMVNNIREELRIAHLREGLALASGGRDLSGPTPADLYNEGIAEVLREQRAKASTTETENPYGTQSE